MNTKSDRYRLTEKGKATAARRNEKLRLARKARRLHHFHRKHRDHALGFDGRLGGSTTAGIPESVTDYKLSKFYPEESK